MPKSKSPRKRYNPNNQPVHNNMSNPGNSTPAKVQHSVTTQHFKGQVFQSNYPPPEMMAAYAEIDPNFPNRLLEMAESEGKHRKFREKLIIVGSMILDSLGMIFGLAAVAGILYTGYLFMKDGHATEAAWIIGAVTATLALAFISRGKRGGNSTNGNKKGE